MGNIADEATRDALAKEDEAIMPHKRFTKRVERVDCDAREVEEQKIPGGRIPRDEAWALYQAQNAAVDAINGTIPLGSCLDRAKQIICGDRQDAYGNPEDSFTLIGEYWSVYLNFEVSPLDVAHLMTLLKVARMQGQKPHRDNYVDACGYLSIAADRLLGGGE